MLNRTAFNKNLSILTGINGQTLDRIGGSLRKAGMVSIGGRGTNAPHITPEDAKNIILGMLGSDNASKAADAVKRLTDLKSPVTGQKAGDAIVRLFTDPDYCRELGSIHVTRNYPQVAIYWGYEEMPETHKEEIFKPDTNNDPPQLTIKAILDGGVVHAIVHLNQWLLDQGL